MESLQVEIVNLVILIVSGLMGIASGYVTSYLKKKGVVAQLEGNKEIVRIVVNAVDQMYKNLKGEEKLDLAKLEVLKMAKSKGLNISEKELDLLIESTVKEMNKSIKNEIKNK